jgi:hypothetical protein
MGGFSVAVIGTPRVAPQAALGEKSRAPAGLPSTVSSAAGLGRRGGGPDVEGYLDVLYWRGRPCVGRGLA